jgi:hypothetical protein
MPKIPVNKALLPNADIDDINTEAQSAALRARAARAKMSARKWQGKIVQKM